MKRLLIIWPLLVFGSLLQAQNTDLPGPAANLQTLPAGSLVIPMDNTLQVNSSGNFNLKAYGLIVYLLNNNVKIKWCITAGKAKDSADFTATAEQLLPALVSGGVSQKFKAGPFVINVADTAGVGALVNAFYTANSLTGANRPTVYRLTAAATVDQRYDLTGFLPKAAVLTDGGNQSIHLAYMTAAAIPAQSYDTSSGSNLISGCFTFASEPHNSKTGTAVNNAITGIKNFVQQGGNFLAQCAAVNNYENNMLGRFQTTGGISVTNTSIGTTLIYPNPDLSFSQFEGAFDGSNNGSVLNWKVTGSTTNNENNHATGTGSNTNIIGASETKHYSGTGGLVFYVGNHSFSSTTTTGINGIRMYMNAFLTPSNTNCPSQLIVLAATFINFTGWAQSGQVILNWEVANNGTTESFAVERSTDDQTFTTCETLTATKSGNAQYSYTGKMPGQRLFYRVKRTATDGTVNYSKTILINDLYNTENEITVACNPISDELRFTYRAQQETTIRVNLFNSVGGLVYSNIGKCVAGDNPIEVPGSFVSTKGIYLLEIINSSQERTVFKVMKL